MMDESGIVRSPKIIIFDEEAQLDGRDMFQIRSNFGLLQGITAHNRPIWLSSPGLFVRQESGEYPVDGIHTPAGLEPAHHYGAPDMGILFGEMQSAVELVALLNEYYRLIYVDIDLAIEPFDVGMHNSLVCNNCN